MTGWRRDLCRAAAIVTASTVLGLATNSLSARPLRVLGAERSIGDAVREPRIGVEELKAEWARGRALLLLDVRSDSSYAAGHSPKALHAPASGFLGHYDRLGLATVLKATEGVVVVCDNDDCAAADRVALQLRTLGHRGVRVLDGGWEAARKAGLEGRQP